MPPRGEVGRGRPGLVDGAAEEARDALVRHDRGEERQRPVEQPRRAVDHRTHRRRLRADHVVVRDEGAQPVGEVDDLGPGDAREEVLRPAGEADHLVREDGPADDHVVVLERQLVERDRHVAAQPAAGELLDLGAPGSSRASRSSPGSSQRWLKTRRAPARPFTTVAPDELRELRVAHRRVRAEGDQEVERGRARAQRLVEHVEEERHRHRARAVGDEHQHAPAVERQASREASRGAIAADLRSTARGSPGARRPTADDPGASSRGLRPALGRLIARTAAGA